MCHVTLSNDINVCTRQFVCHPLSSDEFHKIAERAPSNIPRHLIPTFLQVLRISMWFSRQRGTEQPLSLENLRFVSGKQLLAYYWHCRAAASAVVLALGFDAWPCPTRLLSFVVRAGASRAAWGRLPVRMTIRLAWGVAGQRYDAVVHTPDSRLGPFCPERPLTAAGSPWVAA